MPDTYVEPSEPSEFSGYILESYCEAQIHSVVGRTLKEPNKHYFYRY
jgi:hypothetical protein